MKVNILVTGGAGFIGSNLVGELIRADHRVVVIDDLSTGKLSNIHPHAKLYHTSILLADVADILKQEQITHVFHLAAQIDVQSSFHNPLFDATNNALVTLKLLEACHHSQVEKFIYASTAAVYGIPLSLPTKESHPVFPLSPYGLSKYMGELYLQMYHALYGLTYTICRYANVYGPRQNNSKSAGVIPIFLDQMQKGQSPVIYGDGLQTRDFIYVSDVVKANLLALNHADNQVLNISHNSQTSMNTLVSIINGLLGTRLQPVYQPKRRGDMEQSCLDNTRAMQVLNWQPRFELQAGLAEMLLQEASPE